jgi:hypothetical protein
MKLDELAARTGISRRRIERYEVNGDLSCNELEMIAAALCLPVSHFLEHCCLCGA